PARHNGRFGQERTRPSPWLHPSGCFTGYVTVACAPQGARPGAGSANYSRSRGDAPLYYYPARVLPAPPDPHRSRGHTEVAGLSLNDATSSLQSRRVGRGPHTLTLGGFVAIQPTHLCIISRHPLPGWHLVTALQALLGPDDYLDIIMDRRHGGSYGQ